MKQRRRIYYSAVQRSEIWDREHSLAIERGQSTGGGIVTYRAGGRQLLGVASGMKSPMWPGDASKAAFSCTVCADGCAQKKPLRALRARM